MNLVLFTHPEFLGSQSMPRFANSLAQAYRARSHHVTMRAPVNRLHRLAGNGPIAKWAGYVDQYLIFPQELQSQLKADPADTLYVFCDQALGPWVPRVAHRPHVMHCHDLLALRSALGEFPENPIGFTGRVYQRYIRRGFQTARHFISVSRRTQADLHAFGGVRPVTSEVVYNGMNYPYTPLPAEDAARCLAAAGLSADARGMLLHVSGAPWYKNVPGLLLLYAAYVRRTPEPLTLWIVGVHPNGLVAQALAQVPATGRVEFLHGLDGPTLQAAYSAAQAFLFPSLAEGFGWPIIEAQACGCPVITTDDAPMNEIGGPVTSYLPRLKHGDDTQAWARHGADVLVDLLSRPAAERTARAAQGLAWAARFDTDLAVERYLDIYRQVLAAELAPADALLRHGS